MKTVESVLTVFFEEPFWVGVFERTGSKYEVCKVIFGAEPKGGEIWDFILKRGGSLIFSEGLDCEIPDTKHQNPKRMQREAKKISSAKGVGTKAQQALKLRQEQQKTERKENAKEKREAAKARQFALRQEKKKAKHRGH